MKWSLFFFQCYPSKDPHSQNISNEELSVDQSADKTTDNHSDEQVLNAQFLPGHKHATSTEELLSLNNPHSMKGAHKFAHENSLSQSGKVFGNGVKTNYEETLTLVQLFFHTYLDIVIFSPGLRCCSIRAQCFVHMSFKFRYFLRGLADVLFHVLKVNASTGFL